MWKKKITQCAAVPHFAALPKENGQQNDLEDGVLPYWGGGLVFLLKSSLGLCHWILTYDERVVFGKIC